MNNRINEKIKTSSDNENQEGDLDLLKFTNQLIHKLNQNINNFSYNVIIANMHETYNFLLKHLNKEINSKDLAECYKKILIIFSPILPHLINECLEEMNFEKNLSCLISSPFKI